MIKDKDIRKALETLSNEIHMQENQIDYLNREVDALISLNNSLELQNTQISKENEFLRDKIKQLEQALTESYLTSNQEG